MKLLINLLARIAVLALLPLSAFGQGSNIPFDSENLSRKRIEITRTELSPELDGVLDDEIWKTATLISNDEIHQYFPIDQGTPSERSEFYITYNEDFFYIAARLYDDEPSLISARQLIQGSGMGFDDSFEFLIDTFNNGRTGYQFQVNPNGIRREGIFEGPNSVNRDWSGIWLVEARLDEQGWTAEVAIPFKTINFDPSSDEWGFSISRSIARKQEDVAWSSFNRNVDPSTSGLIYGIHDINQGIGLDIIPSISAVSTENYITGVTDSTFEPSVDVFYKFTPNLTGALTINTDFSATEVDNRQVNLSRFSLFFPEKRDFFLHDVDIFSFGGRSGGGNFNNGGNNGIPFYSRRIGLSSSGQPVGIDAGAKLTGRVGDFNIGGLAVQQESFSTVPSQTLFVGRASAHILNESTVGGIYTQGDPNSQVNNSLMGVDFHYQDTRFSEAHSLSSDMWYQQTDTDGVSGDDKAYGVNANFDTQNNGFGGNAGYTYFGEEYNPALGFANRVGVEQFQVGGSGRYFVQDHPLIRNVFSFMRFDETRRLDTGKLQSGTFFWRMVNMNTHRGDQFGFGMAQNRQGLEVPFSIRPGVVIPAGDYNYTNYHVEAQMSNQRVFALSANYQYGDYYTGTRTTKRMGVQWRPDEHFYFNFNFILQQIDLAQGKFDSRLININANYAINSKWSWINLVQYDNFSSSVGLNSRLHWNPEAGEDLFFVVNYNFDSEGTISELSSLSSSITLKYTKTLRY